MGTWQEFLLKFFLVFFSLSLTKNPIQGGGTSLTNAEIEELERQLNALNKPPVKTIHTTWGDIVDCIDIYKQSAFDHPSLKNHKIHMRPSFYPKERTSKFEDQIEPSNLRSEGINCPEGTVPNRRTTKDELIRAKSLSKKNKSPNSTKLTVSTGYARMLVKPSDNETLIHGASASMFIYNPQIGENQYSSTQFWIQNGSPNEENTTNSLHAGWIVSNLYNDSQTRLFGYWTSDGSNNTGCYNTLCGGFVQIHPTYYLGIPIDVVSTPQLQRYIDINVHQDKDTGNWWFVIAGNVAIGYWPNHIFTSLQEGADRILFGGSAGLNEEGIGPPMGSGSFLDGLLPHECQLRNSAILYYNSDFVFIRDRNLTITSENNCRWYTVDYYVGDLRGPHDIVAIGGPGGACNEI
ncbi:hypothetical protein MKX01_027048 [Papaver californicum]|nr:hypothetical protein MKX01_027048 [Papaver californicum]